jgi:hypothetical protein
VYPSARTRVPSRSSRSKSVLRRKRRAAPSPKRFARVAAATIARAGADRGRAGCAALCVRRECGCAPGSRGAGRAVSWRVDMCAWWPSADPKKGGIRACARTRCQIVSLRFSLIFRCG